MVHTNLFAPGVPELDEPYVRSNTGSDGRVFRWNEISGRLTIADVPKKDQRLMAAYVNRLYVADIKARASSPPPHRYNGLYVPSTCTDTCMRDRAWQWQQYETPPLLPQSVRPLFPTFNDPRWKRFRPRAVSELPRFALITFITAEHLAVHALPISTLSCYCALHGIPFYVETARLNAEQPIHFNKVRTLQKYLPHFQWIGFVDGDNIILNRTKSLYQFLDDQYDVIVQERSNGEFMTNVLVQNSPGGVAFLNGWMNMSYSGIVFNGDNGPLHLWLLRAMRPQLTHACDSYLPKLLTTPRENYEWTDYFAFIRCVRTGLGLPLDRNTPRPTVIASDPTAPINVRFIRAFYSGNPKYETLPEPDGYTGAGSQLMRIVGDGNYHFPSDTFLHGKSAADYYSWEDVYCTPIEGDVVRPARSGGGNPEHTQYTYDQETNPYLSI